MSLSAIMLGLPIVLGIVLLVIFSAKTTNERKQSSKLNKC